MIYKGLELDKFQLEAIDAIEQNKSVVVSAPTGSGKTLIADYIVDRDLKKGVRVIYTAPIKALSNQKYKDFCAQYGEQNVGLITGDTVRNSDAKIVIMTTEIYRNMTITDDPMLHDVSYIVFDEIHYINDVERGYVWEESIIFTKPHIRMLCLSATIPNAEEFAAWIAAIKEHEVVVIRHDVRPIPLHINFYDTDLGVTTLKKIKEVIDIPDYSYVRGRSRERRSRTPAPSHFQLLREMKDQIPALYFCFSRSSCEQKAFELSKKQMFKPVPSISAFIRDKLKEAPEEINQLDSTRKLRTTLPLGIGFHHAGLLPIMKDIVEELFTQGKLQVLYTTETFAVGLNMPAKSVVFDSLRKFDGISFRQINSKEFFQIAGRAGRRGLDTEGFVYVMVTRRDFDANKVKTLIEADTTPITSQFRLSINTVLNLIKKHNEQEIHEILCKSFDSFQRFGAKFGKVKNFKSHSAFDNYYSKLHNLGYLKEGKLTQKGEFSSKIYSDEILIGEMFGTDFYKDLNLYQIMLLFACICLEGRDKMQFHKKFRSKDVDDLYGKVRSVPYLRTDDRLKYALEVTSLIKPCYEGQTIFEMMYNTSMVEGDLVRFLRQIIDKMGQVREASYDRALQDTLREAQQRVQNSLQEIDIL